MAGFGSFLKSSLKQQLGSFDDFSEGFKEGLFGTDYLRDYKHASKTFVADGHALAPTNKFLFHCYFTINTAEIPQLKASLGPDGSDKIGVLVKTVTLPTYSFEVEEMNQYNRKRYIQKKINYRPVSMSFHDDGSDTIRSMWYNYYNYYYNDPSYGYDGRGSNNPGYNGRDIYDNGRAINDWGFDGTGPSGEEKPAFFSDIKVYGMNRGNFTSYTLINPIITEWNHDTFDYSAGGDVMQHTMTINYETVKYGRGKVGGEVKGFGEPSIYDTSPSPLRAGSTASLFGRGGILESGTSILDDLASGNILGAIRTGGSLRNALKGNDVSSLVASELLSKAIDVGTNYISNFGSDNGSGFSIPSPGGTTQNGKIISEPAPTVNEFKETSPSVNQLSEQFSNNTSNTDFTGVFKEMQASIEPGMAVIEGALITASGSGTSNSVPSVATLTDSIPSANSLKETANGTATQLTEVVKSFAPVAENIAGEMKKVANTHESQKVTADLNKIAGDVFSNGVKIN